MLIRFTQNAKHPFSTLGKPKVMQGFKGYALRFVIEVWVFQELRHEIDSRSRDERIDCGEGP